MRMHYINSLLTLTLIVIQTGKTVAQMFQHLTKTVEIVNISSRQDGTDRRTNGQTDMCAWVVDWLTGSCVMSLPSTLNSSIWLQLPRVFGILVSWLYLPIQPPPDYLLHCLKLVICCILSTCLLNEYEWMKWMTVSLHTTLDDVFTKNSTDILQQADATQNQVTVMSFTNTELQFVNWAVCTYTHTLQSVLVWCK